MSSTTAAERPLAGKTALITGASRGIGLACAELLRAAGVRLVMLGRDPDALAGHIKRWKSPASWHFVDLETPQSLPKALASIRELERVPDIIINSAGQFQLKRVDFMTTEEFARIITVNLTSHFAIVREFVPDLRRQKAGHIVTIGSIADRQALPFNAAYAASKHGIRAMHESLREELRGSGVRTTLVSPEHVDTQLWDDVAADMRDALVPRDRMLEAVDVAETVMFALTRPPEVNVDELRVSRA